MKPETNVTSTGRGNAILAAMQEEMRRVVLGEMRSAGQMATLAGRGSNDIRRDLNQWVSASHSCAIAGADFADCPEKMEANQLRV